MKRIRPILAMTTAAVAAFTMLPSPAGADGGSSSSALTATITAGSVGSRTIASTPVAMTSSLDSASLTGGYSVIVTEAARTGTNPWSVTGVLDANLSDGASHSVPRSALSIGGQAVVQVASGGTSSAAGASGGSLDQARTLFSNTGQSTTAVYTGTHTATGNITLTPPNGTVAGVYTGTFTVTLVQ